MLLSLHFCCPGLIGSWEKRYRCTNTIRLTQSMLMESQEQAMVGGDLEVWGKGGGKKGRGKWREQERKMEWDFAEGIGRHELRGRWTAWRKEKYRNSEGSELGGSANCTGKTQDCHVRKGGWIRMDHWGPELPGWAICSLHSAMVESWEEERVTWRHLIAPGLR